MPVVRYFFFAGGVLLLLLFAADHYFPPISEASSVAEVDRSVIRIASSRALPEKIVFDVSRVPAPPVIVAAVHDEQSPGEASSQDALAMMPPARPALTRPVSPGAERTGAERPARHQHAHSVRSRAHRTVERRMAFDHREFFGGW
ncbi:hypothetical protein JQ617_39650 [Bradyrhizobium sp. KB893862 SZCCT0404]|uniref:hypothetical protein n=1 Tax=Bradyrhizobium sp. KB893862 SZCCT0404 TaxID=2807672 RepID=UPI001BAD0091|nr:hypothetical protein [Bradyrhizobium sp. KB893862 SZCCT0404]MBR1180140.1 hypothetical protein [Bradyrhizobium sp. KB893862 SZCCT0404]